MSMFKRGIAALALAGGIAAAVPAASASAGELAGAWICIKYTYILVAGNWVPTVQSVTVSTTPIGCDVSIQLPL
jgi:hypothetical protein